MRVVDEVKRRVRLTNQDFIESQLVRVVACSSEPSSLRLLSFQRRRLRWQRADGSDSA